MNISLGSADAEADAVQVTECAENDLLDEHRRAGDEGRTGPPNTLPGVGKKRS